MCKGTYDAEIHVRGVIADPSVESLLWRAVAHPARDFYAYLQRVEAFGQYFVPALNRYVRSASNEREPVGELEPIQQHERPVVRNQCCWVSRDHDTLAV